MEGQEGKRETTAGDNQWLLSLVDPQVSFSSFLLFLSWLIVIYIWNYYDELERGMGARIAPRYAVFLFFATVML
jgi:hypothetical protein